jgi:hypothetical protein
MKLPWFVDRSGRENGCNERFDGIRPCHLCRQSAHRIGPDNF